MANSILLLHGRLHNVRADDACMVHRDGVECEPAAKVHLQVLVVHGDRFRDHRHNADAEQPHQRNNHHDGKKADDRSHTGQQPQQEKSHRKNGAKSDHRRPDERPEKLDVGFCVQFRMFHHRHGVQAFQQGLRAFFAHQRNQHRQGVTPAAVAGTADVQRDHAENLHHQVLPQVGKDDGGVPEMIPPPSDDARMHRDKLTAEPHLESAVAQQIPPE